MSADYITASHHFAEPIHLATAAIFITPELRDLFQPLNDIDLNGSLELSSLSLAMTSLLSSAASTAASCSTKALPGIDLGDDILDDDRTKLEASLFTHRRGFGTRQLADSMSVHLLVKADCLAKAHLRKLLAMDCGATKAQNAQLLNIMAAFAQGYRQVGPLALSIAEIMPALDAITAEPFYRRQSLPPGLPALAAIELQNNLAFGLICEFAARFFGERGSRLVEYLATNKSALNYSPSKFLGAENSAIPLKLMEFALGLVPNAILSC